MKKRIIFCLILSLFISVHYTHAAIIGETSDGRPISNTGGYGCGPFSGPESQEFREENPGYTQNELYVCDPKPETEWKWPDQVPKPHSTAPIITPAPTMNITPTVKASTITPAPETSLEQKQIILNPWEVNTEARITALETKAKDLRFDSNFNFVWMIGLFIAILILSSIVNMKK